jgi:DNA-directed RNA polymerase specialized sigma24 family protein
MGKGAGPTDVQLKDVWVANRPYLVDLAFAMLRDVGAAEDAVQEAFARLATADFDRIDDSLRAAVRDHLRNDRPTQCDLSSAGTASSIEDRGRERPDER